jgi:hypothetical protein
MTSLTTVDGGQQAGDLTGEELLTEVFDLIARLVPRLAMDDPARPSLVSILPKLGPVVGRPWLARVPTDHEGL